jgi:hypothetical protein
VLTETPRLQIPHKNWKTGLNLAISFKTSIFMIFGYSTGPNRNNTCIFGVLDCIPLRPGCQRQKPIKGIDMNK